MSAQSLIEEVKKRSAWSISMGVLTAALAVFLIIYPLVTATITTVLFGWVLILVDVAQFVFALHSQKVGKFFLKVLVGVLFGIVGFFLAFAPVAGLEALTALLGTMLLVQAGLAKTDRRLGMVLVRCCGKLRIRHIDPRQMALQFRLGDRNVNRRLSVVGWYLKNHDCRKDSERRQQCGARPPRGMISGRRL
jgi:hypothetical protein